MNKKTLLAIVITLGFVVFIGLMARKTFATVIEDPCEEGYSCEGNVIDAYCDDPICEEPVCEMVCPENSITWKGKCYVGWTKVSKVEVCDDPICAEPVCYDVSCDGSCVADTTTCSEGTHCDEDIVNGDCATDLVCPEGYNPSTKYADKCYKMCGRRICYEDKICTEYEQVCPGICVSDEYCGDDIKNGEEECDGTDDVGSNQECTSACTLITLPFCGDESCSNGETCNTCSVDCGTCPLPKPEPVEPVTNHNAAPPPCFFDGSCPCYGFTPKQIIDFNIDCTPRESVAGISNESVDETPQEILMQRIIEVLKQIKELIKQIILLKT